MADAALLALTAAFFLLAWLYVRACERVWSRMDPEYAVGLALSLLLLAYLAYALLRPERF